MSDVINVQKKVGSLDVSPQFDAYSKVVVHVSDNEVIEVGTDVGRTLELTNPYINEERANDILRRLQGFRYQPYKADGAMLDPAAEIGDAINASDVYGGIYTRDKTFGRLMRADVSAPYDEEIDHEYKYESPVTRQFTRKIGEVRASLMVDIDNISATVVKKVDGDESSFGWRLLSDSWQIFSNGTPVFSADANGVEIAGRIKAGTKIGDSDGFIISASAIYKGISSFGGGGNDGVYIGTDGIQLGQNFKVDSGGNVEASNMTLTGTLTIGNDTITANNLRLGAQRANAGYSSWNGTTSTVNSNSGTWSTGANYGYNYNNATKNNTGSYPTYFTAGSIYAASILRASNFSYQGRTVRWALKGAVTDNTYILCA